MSAPAPEAGALRRAIEREIAERGALPFSRYMELCLYHPELGYYARAREQFGKAGDFYTSSDVHAVFGRLLARQFDEMWRALGAPPRIEIVELGPGRGLFAQDVLAWSEKRFPDFFDALHYRLVERSAALRTRIEELLREQVEAGRVSVLDAPPCSRDGACPVSAGGNGAAPAIVFANEFFDALPVEVVTPEGELRVGARAGRFVEQFVAPSAAALEFLDRYGVHPEAGERVEAAPIYREWIERIAAAMPRGFAVIVDYGYTRAELLAGRHRGTVAAFRRHTMSASPYEAPGEQDITAHVNFTALAELGRAAGMEPQPLVTQSQFLLGIGEANQFADAFSDTGTPQERAKVALQLKHLVTPAGMGESFHVLVMAKGVEREKVTGLNGLSFGESGHRVIEPSGH